MGYKGFGACYGDLSPNIQLDGSQGCTKGQKSGGTGSNAARRRCPAAPSDLPKSGGAAAPPAPPLGASLSQKNWDSRFGIHENRPFKMLHN